MAVCVPAAAAAADAAPKCTQWKWERREPERAT